MYKKEIFWLVVIFLSGVLLEAANLPGFVTRLCGAAFGMRIILMQEKFRISHPEIERGVNLKYTVLHVIPFAIYIGTFLLGSMLGKLV